MDNNKFKKSIISFILCFFMLFSNAVSTFAYEWDLKIPPIVNGSSDVIINGSSDITNNQVIINGNNDNSITTNNNNNINISNNNSNVNSNTENNKAINNINVIEEQNITEKGRTVKAKIEPVYQNLTRANKQTFTLVGRDKGATAIVSFKGDETNATTHQLIDYITRHNGDNNSVGYCISPFYAGAKENGTTTVEEVTPTANDKILLGIAVAGYPNNKYNIASLNSLTEEEQYYATLIAMEHFIFQKTGEYKNRVGVKFNDDHWNAARWFPNPNVNTAQKQKAQQIINVAKEIYAKGVANPYDESKGIATINFTDNSDNAGTMIKDTNNYKITININSDINYSHAIIQFTDPIVKQWSTATPSKIQFYDGDENGRRLYYKVNQIAGNNYEGILLEKSSRKSDKLTIVIDKNTADNLITGNVGSHTLDYDVKFFGGNMQVGYKTRNVDTSLQDYIILTTGNATARSSINWNKKDIPTTTPKPGKGGLKILKYNAKTNELVKGAIFKIRGISDDVYDFNVDIQASAGSQIPILNNGATVIVQDGVITIENLEVGTYEITEITPPPNFDLALGQNSQTVQVENQTNATLYPQVRFENNPYGSLKIKKVDAITGQPLAGAVIKISNPLFNYEQEFTTNANGLIEIDDLKQGNYEISEVQAPNGYVLSNEVKTAVLKWGETTEITYENQPKTSLKITKIDSETGDLLSGARFKLKHTTSGAEYTTSATVNGVATITDLVNGTYILTEIQAPTGYILDTTERTIVIENNRVNEVTIKNTKVPSLKITKIDSETGDKLDGAIFKLRHTTSGTEYTTKATVNGVATIENLVEGTYVLTEIQAPTGYILDNTPQNVVIENGKICEVTIKNSKKPSVTINKVDSETKEPLADAKFELWRAENNTIQGLIEKVGEYYTDDKGQITLNNLDYGWYAVKEVKAPKGYLLAENNIKFIFLEPNQTGKNTVEITFENDRKPSVKIIKRDIDTKQVLSGAKFEIWRAENNTTQGLVEKVGEYYTDDKGEIILNNLNYGWYAVKEVQAPNGYLLSEDNTKFVFLEPNQTGDSTKEIIFENAKKPNLIINKIGSVGKEPLQGAKFSLFYAGDDKNGAVTKIGDYITDQNGKIEIPTGTLQAGWYKLQEIQAPAGYEIQGTGTYEFFLKAGESKEIIIENVAKNSIVIKKVDADTGEPLAGANFSVTIISDGNSSGTNGTTIANVITNHNGVAVVTGLKAGGYIIEETKAPAGYVMTEQTETVWLNKDDTSAVTVTFENRKNAGLGIKKMDSITKEPLANAIFKVTDSKGQVVGTGNGLFRTDEKGFIHIPNLKTGAYVVQEVQSPDGYVLDNTPQTVHIEYGKLHTLEFFNTPKTSIVIKKYDSETKEPLANATFKVTDSKGAVVGNGNGIFTTNENGTILVSNLKAGTYIVEEIQAPDGYMLDKNSQTVEVENGKVYTLDFYNKPTNSLIIMKYDAETKEPLANATFKVTDSKGAVVGNSNGIFTTNENGTILVSNLKSGTYIVEEIQAPDGYILDKNSQVVEVENGKVYTLDFYNKPTNSLVIMKYDSQTKEPLADAKIKVEKLGNSVELIGEYRTDETGRIVISNLKPGSYSVQEIESPDGYILDNTAKTVVVKQGEIATVELFNKKLAGLLVKVLDKETRKPIPNSVVKVIDSNGTLISPNGNARTKGTGYFTTNENGYFTIPNLAFGTYFVEQVEVPKGYILENSVKTVNIKTSDLYTVEILNPKMAGIQILKRDSKTGKPLQGAKFEVRKVNGELVGASYVTDSNGLITINGLEKGWYTVKETVAPNGYALNSNAQNVEVKTDEHAKVVFDNDKLGSIRLKKIDYVTRKAIPNVKFKITKENGENIGEFVTDRYGEINLVNKLSPATYLIEEIAVPNGYALDKGVRKVKIEVSTETIVEWENYPLATLEIIKTDERTKKPIVGVEFEILNSKKESMGKFTTDSSGRICLEGKFAQGTYYVKETKAKDGYIANDGEKMVDLKWGKTTKVEFVNTPIFGYIEIHKVGSKNNQITGQLDGENLAGAEFTIYDKANRKEIIRVITGSNGVAKTGELPYGDYLVKETKAPAYYILNETEYEVSIKNNKETVKLEVANQSVDLQTGGEKSTVKQTKAGDTIRYDFNNLQNLSTVPLENFYIHDSLPSALTAQRLFTGTFNQNMKYKITYKTNKNSQFKVLKDNLFTDRVYEIDLTKGLQQGEYITDIRYEFDKVGVGFREVEKPFLYAKVNSNVKKNEQFTNILTVGGKYGMQTVKHEDKFTTTVISTTSTFENKLPKTGY